jgi:hypothetical protein
VETPTASCNNLQKEISDNQIGKKNYMTSAKRWASAHRFLYQYADIASLKAKKTLREKGIFALFRLCLNEASPTHLKKIRGRQSCRLAKAIGGDYIFEPSENSR